MSANVKPGYRKTEVGVIPNEWQVKSLSEISDKIMVGIASSATHAYRSEGVPLLRNQNIKPGYLDDSDVLYVAPSYEEGFKNKRLLANDILIARTGYPGTACIVPEKFSAAQSFTTLITRPTNSKADSLYLCYYINSEFGQAFFEQNQIGGAQKNVNAASLQKMPVPLPTLAEQQEIASALSGVDELISSLDQLLAKKRDIQQATMQQLLTGQRRLPGFSGKWRDGQLRNVVRSLEAGVSVNSTDDLPEPGLPCVLKTSALSGGIFLPNEAKAIVAADRTRACTNPKQNTILISRMNTPALVGEIAYVEKDYDWLFLPDRLWMTQLTSDDCVNVRWLSYLLSSCPYRKLLQDSATGTSGSMKNISKGALLDLQISYPTIEEQSAIATILSDMNTELAALEARRDKARQLKQGMMQELLTGRIRLV